MSDIARALRNSWYLVASQLVSKVVAMVSLVWLARYVSVENYGVLNFALSFWAIVMIVVEGGSGAMLVREVSRDHSLAPAYLGGTMLLKTTVGIITLFVAIPVLWTLGVLSDSDKLMIFLLLGSGQYALQIVSYTITVLFRAHEAFKFESLLSVISSFVGAVGLIVAILLRSSFFDLVLVMLFSNLLTVLLNVYFYARMVGGVKITVSKDFLKAYAGATVPFAVTFIVGGIALKIGVPLLSHFSGDQAVGIYSASMRIMEGLLFVPSALMTTLYPLFSRSFGDSDSIAITALRGVMHFFLLIALPVCFLSTFYRMEIVHVLYGEKYIETSSIWPQWTAWLFVTSSKSILSLFLLSINEHKFAALVNVIGFAITLMFSLLLIPGGSYVGATTSVLAAEVIMLLTAGAYLLKKKYWFLMPVKTLKLSTISGLLIVLFYVFHPQGIVLGSSIFVLGYLVGIFLLRVFAHDEIMTVLGLYRKKAIE